MRYQKKKGNGGVKCAINQTKPYPLLFVSSTMQPTIIVDADAIFKKWDYVSRLESTHSGGDRTASDFEKLTLG